MNNDIPVSTDFHNSYNGILLTDHQVSVLNNYGFDINKYNSVQNLIFDLEDYLNEESEIDELEQILDEISEFNYYYNTKK